MEGTSVIDAVAEVVLDSDACDVAAIDNTGAEPFENSSTDGIVDNVGSDKDTVDPVRSP